MECQLKEFYEELFSQYLKDVCEYEPDSLTEAGLEELIGGILEDTAVAAGKKEVDTDVVNNIFSMMERYGVHINIEEAIEGANIRLDFDRALTGVQSGTELSSPLSYALGCRDLAELAKLHKAGKHRDKIIDLLEDCNFHPECKDFINGKYSGYIKEE